MKKVDHTRVHFIERCNPQRHTKDMTKKKEQEREKERERERNRRVELRGEEKVLTI